MKLNNEYRYGYTPTVHCPRSTFNMHQNIRTTFNAGQLIPFYVDSDIMPGDTFNMNGTVVIRLSTPIYPTMDNLMADIRFFFVPHRITWTHWKEFMGENENGSWTSTSSYAIPRCEINGTTNTHERKVEKGDILNYMGIPIGYPNQAKRLHGWAVNALPYRAYVQVWNDWYRDENFAAPCDYNKGNGYVIPVDGDTNAVWGKWNPNVANNYVVPAKPAPVYKFKDMFNACLPQPQKGPAVTLPIGDTAPVAVMGNGYSLGMTHTGATNDLYNATIVSSRGISLTGGGTATSNLQLPNSTSNESAGTGAVGLSTNPNTSGIIGTADLSNAVAATINAQRLAFATQRIAEACARSGTRYAEIISNIWNVKGNLSAVLQRAEYIGGVRLPISMSQVVQTSSTDTTSPQGNTAAMSLTVDSQHYFTKSFTEHGTLLGVLCVRQEHSYDQGIARMWTRSNKLDFYWPQLAFIGEQAILNKEIYADGSSNDDEVFGYNERWIEYKSKVNINTGAFSTQYAQSLDSWHYGDDYSSLPVLSKEWRAETKDYIDRTLAVTSAVEDQFIMDSRWEMTATRPIPLYSIPSLIDHF